MYLLIVLLPLVGFLCAALGGFYFGREGSSLLVCMGQILAWVASLIAFYEVVLAQAPVVIHLWDWLILDGYCIRFGLLFDALTVVMVVIILSVSLCVHIYSLGYMAGDPYLVRFLAYLSLFTFFMLVLVSADNFLQMFVGWEGVGLCSYLLINFWYKRIQANKAALKAMLLNRVADVLLLLGILLALSMFKTLDFLIVFELAPLVSDETMVLLGSVYRKIDVLCFFLFLGAVGKSAQLGLHMWLPDAMEGPTPVSALLHAATMVTAGVFLMIRCGGLFAQSEVVLFLAATFGCLTSWYFSVTGAFQYDIKKVIAYSTCSQLGYMFFCCGLSLFPLALFHLFNHAFFKALLFLSAGAVIHSLHGEQDIRRMGSLVNFLPFTYFCMFLGSLAILGFPFFSGFYSKDLILELAASRYVLDGLFIHFLGTSSAFFTALYSLRFLSFVFLVESNAYRRVAGAITESGWWMTIPLIFLCLLSIFSGYVCSELFVGAAGGLVLPAGEPLDGFGADTLDVPPWVKNLPLFCSLVSFGFYALGEELFFGPRGRRLVEAVGPYFFYAHYFNTLFNRLFVGLHRISYRQPTKAVDKGFLEFFGPYGIYRLFFSLGTYLRRTAPAVLFFHLCVFTFGVVLLLLLYAIHAEALCFLSDNLGLFALILGLLSLDAFLGDR